MRRQSRRARRSIAKAWRSLDLPGVGRWWSGVAGEIRAHPWRAGGVGLLFAGLVWLVLTTTLPAALAPDNPDLALALNSSEPAALMAKAEALRRELLASADRPTDAAPQGSRGAPAQNLIGQLPEVASPADAAATVAQQRQLLRRQIADIADRTIAADPLNAEAFRLLAEVADDAEEERRLMREAVKRSRRESAAMFRLLNDGFERKDYAAALDYADMLLRTRHALTDYVMSYLGPIADDPDGRALLLARLEEAPRWSPTFFRALPRHVQRADTPLALMLAMKADGRPVPELGPYLQFLVDRNLVDIAYDAWVRLLPAEQLEQIGLLVNPSFEAEPTGVPFDWQIARGRNAVMEFAALRELGGQRALHIAFGTGRVGFPVLSQVLVLPPGRYRLEGVLRGSIIGERGLRWRVACLAPPAQVLAETEMLVGQSQSWRAFSLNIDVPQAPNCRGQQLRLYHDARSASEELVSGEVWFDDLKLQRAVD